ncbi:hypothetical protein ACFMPD_13550 [Sedimentitalea sp. HM32M-2]|uniref:hypothetical protein n=1 Tax=Sedimentitalea sp. HM32M-2 TaxID=3351566 RepID=UPI003643B5DF
MNEGYLGSARIDNYRSIHIAELSQQSIIDSEAEHLGFGGYFLFETQEGLSRRGLKVLARVASLDAAFEMLDLWRVRQV